MTDTLVDRYAEEVRALIEERLRLRGKTLARVLTRAGRLLPKWAQRDGDVLVQAQNYAGHPKLRQMVDKAQVDAAHRRLVAHLKTVDPVDRRKGQILGVLGVISFNLILVVGAFLAFLVWRGYV